MTQSTGMLERPDGERIAWRKVAGRGPTVVWLSGSLYVAMAAHVAYDVTAGIAYGRLARTLGYDASPPAQPQP